MSRRVRQDKDKFNVLGRERISEQTALQFIKRYKTQQTLVF